MPALTRSLYLAFNKGKVKKEVSFNQELSKAKKLLVRLAEKPPYTLFSLYTVAALKQTRKNRKITVLYPADAQHLLVPFNNNFFTDRIEIAESPKHGSKTFKALKEKLSVDSFDLFIDLDPKPLPELAILSAAKLRMTYKQDGIFPFFNILFALGENTNLQDRAKLIARHLGCKDRIEDSIPVPNVSSRKAADWLRRKGVSIGKQKYLVTTFPLRSETVAGMKVVNISDWNEESLETRLAVLDGSVFYVGGADRNTELAYLLGVKSLVYLRPADPLMPGASFMRIIQSPNPPGAEELEQAFTSFSL